MKTTKRLQTACFRTTAGYLTGELTGVIGITSKKYDYEESAVGIICKTPQYGNNINDVEFERLIDYMHENGYDWSFYHDREVNEDGSITYYVSGGSLDKRIEIRDSEEYFSEVYGEEMTKDILSRF